MTAPTLEASVIAPGLALTVFAGRFALVHEPSGYTVAHDLCEHHILNAAMAAIGTGIDWTADLDTAAIALLNSGYGEIRERLYAACRGVDVCHLMEVIGRD
jgi:hypothetical protein